MRVFYIEISVLHRIFDDRTQTYVSNIRSKIMSALAKLTVKTVTRISKPDPVQQRRQKLVAGIEEQLKVAAAAANGESYEVRRKVWAKNEHGEKVLVERMRKVRG